MASKVAQIQDRPESFLRPLPLPPGGEPVIDVPIGKKWKGFQNSKPADEIDISKAATGSLNMLLDSTEGMMVRRRGIATANGGSALTEIPNATGTIELKTVEIVQHQGPGLSSAAPSVWRALFIGEEVAAGAYAQVAWRDNATNRVIADQGAWSPAAPNALPPANLVVWPWLLGNRAHTAIERRKTAAGSRNSIDVADRVFYGNFGSEVAGDTGAPMNWNKRRSNFTPAEFATERCMNSGLMPPIWLPTIMLPAPAGAPTSEPWFGSDMFYYSVLYIYEDGSWGMPVQVRAPNVNLSNVLGGAGTYINPVGDVGVGGKAAGQTLVDAGGYGLCRLNATAANRYAYIRLVDIPTGPGNVIGRVVLRSPKVNGTTTTPDPKDLRVWFIINNNTQTSYDATEGLDIELRVDLRIRIDHVMQPPARYLGEFDQRVAVSYIRDIPWAIQIAFRHNGAFENSAFGTPVALHNTPDTGFDTTRQAYVQIDGTNVELLVRDPGTNFTHRRQYAQATTTLQQLVDKINSQRQAVAGDTHADYRWYAQLMPGADGSALANTLTNTGAWGDNAYTTATGVGTLDGQNELAVVIGVDGIRSMSSGWHVTTRSSAHVTRFRDRIAYTQGGPGVVPNAAMAYTAFNQRTLPPEAGFCAGPILPMLDGGLVPGTKAVCALRNVRDGKTGLDEDYRVEVFDSERGVISPSCGLGPGFVVVLTNQGLMAYDRETYEGINISLDLYNPDTDVGELRHEISECVEATAKDDSSGYFSIKVAEGMIWISYRSNVQFTRPDRMMVMDFTPGIAARGIKALIDPETGRPWGWSPPHVPNDTVTDDSPQALSFAGIGVIRYADGVTRWFGGRDAHVNGVNDGILHEFNTGAQDVASNIDDTALYSAILRVNDDYRKRVKVVRASMKYKKNTTGLTVQVTRNPRALTPTWSTAKALPSTGTDDYGELIWNPLLSFRTPAKAIQFRWLDDGTGTVANRPQIWGAIAEVKVVDTGAS